MIKLSLQSLSYRDTFKAGNIDLMGIIDQAYELQMDGVDLHYTHFASTDPEYLEELRLATLRRGLHMCYIGVSNNFGKKGAELEQQAQLVRDWVDVAATMGIQMVRVFGAWVPEDETEEDVWPRLLETTRQVTAYARSRRVVLGLHNHNHGCMPATGEQVVRLMDAVDDPYYSHILDTGQYRGSPGASFGERGKEDPEHNFYGSIETSAPRAVHVRAKIYRIASGEEAWLDYNRIMPILKKVGFNGWMSVVFEGQDELDEPAAAPLATAYLRRMLAQHDM
ncbi:MAG: TIM barrel protein [Dehalococcoidia bacterium]